MRPSAHCREKTCALLLALGLATVGAIGAAVAQDDESAGSLGLGQGLHIAPLQRSLPLATSIRTQVLAEPDALERSASAWAGTQRRNTGFSLFRNSNWMEGDRLSFHLSGGLANTNAERLGLPDTNGVWSGAGAPGLSLGRPTLESGLDYSAPISPRFGLGLSVSQRAGGLRESGFGDERTFSLRFTGRF